MPERILISDDPGLIDIDAVHGYLTRSYWAKGIPRVLVERSIAHSVCIAAYDTSISREPDSKNTGDTAVAPSGRPALVGFARIVTDHATFAYLCDVFVLETHQRRGIGTILMDAVMAHPGITGRGEPGDPGVRRFMLMTLDAHGLYTKYGFEGLSNPDRAMQKVQANAYANG